MPPIFVITGPPGSGKTTLSLELLQAHPFGFHLEVDIMRTWVKQGLSESVPWTDETERQFRVAEDAAVDVALRYQRADFAVCIDHCRHLARLDELCLRFEGLPVVKICLLPPLEINLHRNGQRTNKSFDPSVLNETIRFVHHSMQTEPVPEGWHVFTEPTTPPEIAAQIMGR